MRTSLAAALALLVSLGSASPALASRPPLDVVLCIDTSALGSAGEPAARAAALRLLSAFSAPEASVRVALVVSTPSEGAPKVERRPFVPAAVARRELLAMTTFGGGAQPFATIPVALDTDGWRDGVARVVIVIAGGASEISDGLDALLDTAQASKAHVFSLLMANASNQVRANLARLASQTAGAVVSLRTAPADEVATLAWLSVSSSSPTFSDGQIVTLQGPDLEVQLERWMPSIHPGQTVLVFSRATPGLLIAEAIVTAGTGSRFTVQPRSSFTLEPIGVGCEIKVIPE